MDIYNMYPFIKNRNKFGPPANYISVDKFLSRSAQPTQGNIDWLCKNNVTDIVNFRRSDEFLPTSFDEKKYVESKNMKYHNIPTYTNYPEEKKIKEFLNIVDDVKKNGGKMHIHCREGADRTGLYAYVYERLANFIPKSKAYRNFINGGWHDFEHPHLANVAEEFVKKMNKVI